MSRINIFNATAEDFQIEIFETAPADGSTGDYEEGRIVKYLTHFYIWHNTSGAWKKFGNSTDVTALETLLASQEADRSTEHAAFIAADSSIESSLTSAIATRSLAVDSAQASAELAEGSLESSLTAATAARQADISTELARAVAAEGSLESSLNSAIASRQSDVTAELARAVSEEGSLESSLTAAIASRQSDVTAEAARADSVEVALAGELTTAIAAASTEESALTVSVASANTRALTEEAALLSSITSANVRAVAAEAVLSSGIDVEEARISAIIDVTSGDPANFSATVALISTEDAAYDASAAVSIETVDTSKSNAISSRVSEFASVQTGLDSEASTEASKEVTMNSLMTAQSAREVSGETSLNTLLTTQEASASTEESALLSSITSANVRAVAAEAVLSSNVDSQEALNSTEESALTVSLASASARASVVESNQTVSVAAEATRADGVEVSLTALLAVEAARADGVEVALTASIANELSTMNSTVASMQVVRSTDDATLQASIDSEQSSMLSGNVALSAAASSLELVGSTERSTLAANIVAEAQSREADDDDIAADILTARSSLNVRDAAIASSIASVETRTDEVLLNAGATADFSSVVALITSLDGDFDDALDSLIVVKQDEVLSLTASSSTELSTISAGIVTEASVMNAAVATSLASISTDIATHATAIDTKEQHEGEGRHMRVTFSGETSFTVAASDLPTNFEPGNGMVQVFQDMGSNKFRHLVAPASYNPTTGAMSFELGSTAKSGFVVFYSFAGDEGDDVTEVSSLQQFQIAVSNSSYTSDKPDEISESLGSATFKSTLYIADLDNAVLDSSGYSPQWTINKPTTMVSDWSAGTHVPFMNFGTHTSSGTTGAYIRWYSQQSTDGGSTWSSTDSNDVALTLYETSFGGQDYESFPGSTSPAQTAGLNDVFKVWAEGYNTSGVKIFEAGSESSPYYTTAHDYDFTQQGGSFYGDLGGGNYGSAYWDSTNENTQIKAEIGDTKSVSLANPSQLSAGDQFTDYLVSMNSNYSSSSYGWNSGATDWVISGTDAAEFDIKPYDSGDQSSLDNSSSCQIKFKENGGSYDRVVPSNGTYSITLTASSEDSSGNAQSDTVWNITIVVS